MWQNLSGFRRFVKGFLSFFRQIEHFEH